MIGFVRVHIGGLGFAAAGEAGVRVVTCVAGGAGDSLAAEGIEVTGE